MTIICVRRYGRNGSCGNPSFWVNAIIYSLIQAFLPMTALMSILLAECECKDVFLGIDSTSYMTIWFNVAYYIGYVMIILVGIYNYFDPMDTLIIAGQSSSTVNGVTTTTFTTYVETDYLLYNKNSIGKRGINKYLVHFIIWNFLIFTPILIYITHLYVFGTQKCEECCSIDFNNGDNTGYDSSEDCYLLYSNF